MLRVPAGAVRTGDPDGVHGPAAFLVQRGGDPSRGGDRVPQGQVQAAGEVVAGAGGHDAQDGPRPGDRLHGGVDEAVAADDDEGLELAHPFPRGAGGGGEVGAGEVGDLVPQALQGGEDVPARDAAGPATRRRVHEEPDPAPCGHRVRSRWLRRR